MEIKIRDTTHTDGKIWHKACDPNYWHREDGPACIINYGKEEWWYNDIFYEFPEQMPMNLFLAYCKWEYKKKNEKISKN